MNIGELCESEIILICVNAALWTINIGFISIWFVR